MRVTLTPSQLLALTDLVCEHVQREEHTAVYLDVVRDVQTTPTELLAVLLAALERPSSPMRWKCRYQVRGDHVHVRVFTAPRGVSFAKSGDLVFAAAEWPHVADRLQELFATPEEDA